MSLLFSVIYFLSVFFSLSSLYFFTSFKFFFTFSIYYFKNTNFYFCPSVESFFLFSFHLPVRYQHELPVAIQERKIKCITHAELCKLMKWKLMVRISVNLFLFVRLLTFWNVSKLSQCTVFVLKWDVQFKVSFSLFVTIHIDYLEYMSPRLQVNFSYHCTRTILKKKNMNFSFSLTLSLKA